MPLRGATEPELYSLNLSLGELAADLVSLGTVGLGVAVDRPWLRPLQLDSVALALRLGGLGPALVSRGGLGPAHWEQSECPLTVALRLCTCNLTLAWLRLRLRGSEPQTGPGAQSCHFAEPQSPNLTL